MKYIHLFINTQCRLICFGHMTCACDIYITHCVPFTPMSQTTFSWKMISEREKLFIHYKIVDKFSLIVFSTNRLWQMHGLVIARMRLANKNERIFVSLLIFVSDQKFMFVFRIIHFSAYNLLIICQNCWWWWFILSFE